MKRTLRLRWKTPVRLRSWLKESTTTSRAVYSFLQSTSCKSAATVARTIAAIVPIETESLSQLSQVLYLLFRQVIHGPVADRFGAEVLIETDRFLVPIKNRPLHSSAVVFGRPLR
jgi:hypothetical protein